ncbi:MAG: hypothetical protein LC114_23325, partial [Bryobacterales bacterium]|nr:hypothetical protein [Bryobacterales bacterium]
MLQHAYSRWIEDWENRLCFRTNNRVVRPFDWGSEWTSNWPTNGTVHLNGQGEVEFLREINRRAIDHSDAFYGYESPRDFVLKDGRLTFTSAVHT